jgi:hypothetical protein
MRLIFTILILLSQLSFSQVTVTPSSTVLCETAIKLVGFSMGSGQPPFSYTVYTPCSSSFSNVTNNTSGNFSVTCNGIYSLTVIDQGNSLIGSVTHTANVEDSLLITLESGSSLLCLGQGTSVYPEIPSVLSNFSWSNGSSAYAITVYPVVTTAYSVTSLYTHPLSPWTKTCTAVGFYTITVKDTCSTNSIHEEAIFSDFRLYPNPVADYLNVSMSSFDATGKISIKTIAGVTLLSVIDVEKIDVAELPQGMYFLIVEGNYKKRIFKFVKK